MSTIYKDNLWYWQENDVLYGGYETESETNREKYCTQGSKKYQLLKEGKLKPRIGDFVKSKSGGCESFIAAYGKLKVGNTWTEGVKVKKPRKYRGLIVEKPPGKIYKVGVRYTYDFIALEDVHWIAPVEWDDVL